MYWQKIPKMPATACLQRKHAILSYFQSGLNRITAVSCVTKCTKKGKSAFIYDENAEGFEKETQEESQKKSNLVEEFVAEKRKVREGESAEK